MEKLEGPPRAKKVGGVWLPDTEEHFVDWMQTSKHKEQVDGKLTYQYHKLKRAMELQPAGRFRTAIDIGAHVGLWSMWLTHHFRWTCAFEPVPWFREIFSWNVDLSLCTLFPMALGKEPGEISITIPLGQTGAAHVSTRKPVNVKYDQSGEFETVSGVKVLPLDSFDISEIDFIKIDVEGVEADVIRGAEKTIKTWRPNIVVEQKGNDAAYGEKKNAALDLLLGWGMTPVSVLSGDYIMAWKK